MREITSRKARSTHSRAARLLLKATVSTGLLLYLFHLVDLAGIGRVLRTAELRFVALGFVLYLCGQVLSGLKWRMLAEPVGLQDHPLRFVRHYFVGMFFNVFGLGTVGGDVVRALALAGPDGRRTLALNTVVADRGSGLLVLVAIALGALLAFRTYELPAVVYWSTLLLCSSLLIGWRLAPSLVPFLFASENWFRRLVERDLAPYWNDYGLLARIAVFSLVFHGLQIFVQVMLARSLGLTIPWSYFLIFGPLVNIYSALPISLNGLGVREAGYVFFLDHIGIPREAALAFALMWFGIVLASALTGGLVYVTTRGDFFRIPSSRKRDASGKPSLNQ